MSEVDISHLILLVEARPVLWDKSLDIFTDRDATRSAWREVCLELRKDFDELEDRDKNDFGKEVLKRWKNLRDAFVKSTRKTKETKTSGGSKWFKKRKYIFYEELQFLNKVYFEKDTSDAASCNNETNKTEDHLETPTTSKEIYKPVSKSPPKARKNNKSEETDLKMLFDKPQEQLNSKMSFFHSLMPHVQDFADNEMLDFQMCVLQVISNIKNKRAAVPVNLESTMHYPHHSQSTPYYLQPVHAPPYYLQPHSNPFPRAQATSNRPTQVVSETRTPSAQRYQNSLIYSSDELSERSASVNSASSSIMYDFT